jgi:endoglucanase
MLKKTYLYLVIAVFIFFEITLGQQIVGIHTASPRVLVVVIQNEIPAEVEVHFTPDMNGTWRVNNSTVGRYRHSYVWDQGHSRRYTAHKRYSPIIMRHNIYLELSQNIQNNTSYEIKTPYGDTTLVFHDQKTWCESIKVNQVGYNRRSRVRYANIGIWLGDGKSRTLDSLPTFRVIDTTSGITVHVGKLVYWGDDTREPDSTNSNSQIITSGEHVYRADLSGVQDGGPYIISIEGMGISYPFGIGDDYSKEIAKVHVRGMYHQRCGIALEEPYTKFTRGICHEHVAFTKTPFERRLDSTYNPNTWIQVPEGSPMHKVIGGYHDAADFDRRPMHTIIPILMLGMYDAFPDHFIDGQYNIPESGNGIPDFLDESLWGVLLWEHLQLDSTNSTNSAEWGGVMAGTEANRHPGYGGDRADTDPLVYGTYEVILNVTLDAAGMFAQAARLLRPYDSARSDALLSRAKQAWDWAIDNDKDKDPGSNSPSSYLYASLQMYLATARNKKDLDSANTYHTIFRNLANEHIVQGGKWPYQYKGGNASSKITASHFISYLITPFYQDSALSEQLKQKIFETSHSGGYMGWKPETFPYPQGVTKFMGWGTATTQGRYTEAPMYAYRLSQDISQKQTYFDIVSQLSDYSLGLNPLGQSYVSALGSNPPNSPLHLDSWYTKYGYLPDSSRQPILGNVPGIVIYGPSWGRSGMGYQRNVSDKLYPVWESLPGQRRWTDGWSLINSNEFTTWETMVWNVVMYSFLYKAPGHVHKEPIVAPLPQPEPPASLDEKDPNSEVTLALQEDSNGLVTSFELKYNATEGLLLSDFTLKVPTHTEFKISDIQGRTIKNMCQGVLNAGLHSLAISVKDLPDGMYFVQINDLGGKSFVKSSGG